MRCSRPRRASYHITWDEANQSVTRTWDWQSRHLGRVEFESGDRLAGPAIIA